MKSKKILIFIFIFGLLGIIPNYLDAQRRTEVTYPEIPGMTVPPTDVYTPLPQFISYVFNLIISLCGLACFASLIYGAIIFITSRGNPSAMLNARSQIFVSFLGTVLSLGALIIAQTINPQLLVPQATMFITTNVCLSTSETCETCTEGGGGTYRLKTEVNPLTQNQLLTTLLDRANPFKIFFALAAVHPGNGGSGSLFAIINSSTEDIGEQMKVKSIKFFTENVDIIAYPEPSFEGSPSFVSGAILTVPTVQQADGCYKLPNPINARSVEMFLEVPGVYVCTEPYERIPVPGTSPTIIYKEKCSGLEKYIPGSVAELPEEIDNKIRGLKIIDETKKEFLAYKDTDYRIIDNFLRPECENDAPNGLGGKFWRDVLTGNWFCTYPVRTYGVVLHDFFQGRGPAEIFTKSDLDLTDGSNNQFLQKNNTIDIKTSSITVFSRPIFSTSSAADKGVWFCKNINQEFNRTRSDCYGPFSYDYPDRDLSRSGIPDNQISSIIIEGNFIAILFSERNYDGFAEVFITSCPNFRDRPMGRCNCIVDVFGIEQSWGCKDCLSSFIVLATSAEK